MKLLTITEVSFLLGISKNTVIRLIKQKQIKKTNVGRLVRIKASNLKKFGIEPDDAIRTLIIKNNLSQNA